MIACRLILILVLLVFGAEMTLAQDGAVTFKKKTLEVGERVRRRVDTKVVMRAGEGDIYHKTFTSLSRVTEILERNKAAVTKYKVHCLKHNRTEGVENPKTAKSIVAGKSFILEKRGGATSVKDLAGKELEAKLKEFVIERFTGDFYDFETPFLKALDNGKAYVGKEIEIDRKLANEMFRDDDPSPDAFKAESMSLTLKSVDENGLARFSSTIVFISETKGVETTRLVLRGLTEVETATCRLRQFDLKGPLTFTNSESDSRGIVIFRDRAKYLPKREAKATKSP